MNINIPIYWINLERSKYRRAKMEAQLNKYNIKNHKRIEAVDGNKLDFSKYKDNCNDITVYELACTLSHIKAIKTAHNDNVDYALIMEDDCNFEYVQYQKYSINELIDQMNTKNSNWNILQLCTSGRIDQNIRIRDNPNLIEKFNKNCTIAYLISKKGIESLLQCTNKYSQADRYLYENDSTRKYPKTYFLTKPYFSYYYSKNIVSDVHNQGKQSRQTNYNREDTNKQFWDNYYLSLK